MKQATWYFDFISPYSYFGLYTLKGLPASVEVALQPVLFAGLLKVWGQKGPAEIPTKRQWTYRACVWWAQRNRIPFQLPAAHPFNPLPFLRLSIAAGNSLHAVRAIFTRLWTTGLDPADTRVVAELAESLEVPLARLDDPAVKQALRDGTEQAIARGVFGVPTLDIDGQLFWGSDSVDFAAAYLAKPQILSEEEFRRADRLPVGVTRPGSAQAPA
jgi:2-hydroxychromene-2-carboxylate isomerase